ncbi:DUF5808 domain-containing protein [uncultured Flavonifractor sp.]|uniref:DUF5808 domain-containing protein n=1 Tax=uncultured Flavonifractor sp. TaxID=1193534 RepID=UPI00261DA05E|nr:DUF5808 domain-containing protein [uncultured Flavonifractor sp.]
MIAKLILWGSTIWLVPLMYFFLKNEANFKKNIAVGVTFPCEGRTHPEVLDLLARFKKELGRTCLALLALAAVLLLLPVSFGPALTLFLVWTDLCVVLPVVPYVRCNKALKALKRELGWENRRRQTVVADLRAAARPEDKKPSARAFALPLVASVLPVWWALGRGESLEGLILLLNPGCVALFWLCWRFAFRRKAEVVDENEDLTAALTRLRRRAWRRCWLWGAWFMALLSWAMLLTFDHPLAGLILMFVLSAAMVAAMAGLEFRLRKLQERLTAGSGRDYYVDEDDKWLWGMFYYDPNDSHLIINARVGLNTTVNMARPAGKVIMLLTAAMLLLMPLAGVWIMGEERAPVTLALTDTALVAAHASSRYQIPLTEIDAVELLEALPDIRRVAGTAMDTVDKGRWRCEEYGPLTVCLDPRTGPWLLIQAKDATYLVGSGDGGAGGIYTALSARLAGQTAPAAQSG